MPATYVRASAGPTRLRRWSATAVLLVVLAGVSVGCGDGDDAGAVRRSQGGPFLNLSEVRSVLERGELELVQTGGSRDYARGHDSSLLEVVRYESNTGREFDVLVFATQRAARQALPSLLDGDDASAARAANVVAVFPERFSEVDTYRAVAAAMRRLRNACAGTSDDERLRRLCFGGDRGVRPRGEGVDRDEAAAVERPVVVGGLRYEPVIARRLNSYIKPDSEMLSGRRPDDGKLWFGVFVRVCNDSGQTRTPSERMALVDAFGGRVERSRVLRKANPFAYTARPIESDRCLPAPASVAARVNDGALVLFETTSDFLSNRPIALEVTGEDGGRGRVVLDV